MCIRKSAQYDPRTSKYTGFVSLGDDFGPSDDELATEALVFMAVGITGSWKCPFAYFLIKGISANIQAELVSHALQLLEDTGIQCRALTLDGHKTNLSMMRKLGCNFNIDNLSSAFEGPSGQDINVFLDPSHCLKLVRNIFAKLGSIEVPGIGTASWKHVANLHELQEREQLRAGNKLTNRHIRFEQQKMKVSLLLLIVFQFVNSHARNRTVLIDPLYADLYVLLACELHVYIFCDLSKSSFETYSLITLRRSLLQLSCSAHRSLLLSNSSQTWGIPISETLTAQSRS